jgi:hypothetical protein
VRIFALSDIHADYAENMAWIQGLSARDYSRDVLLLAGDICHEIGKLEAVLKSLREKFAEVFFLNGNHDLWLIDSDCSDSLQKFHRILDLCRALGVRTERTKLDNGHGGLWIVPLFAWYDKPEDTQNSLFVPRAGPGDEMLDAIDLLLDFTGVTAGTLSYDFATVFNTTGNRNGSMRVYTSIDGTTFTELPAASVVNFTNNVAYSQQISLVQLPPAFTNCATARIRFYDYNGTGPTGSSGARPKASIDRK